jgi:RimJ/RimL family protein N-acetyltransferase
MERFATERLIAERFREDHLADLVSLHLDPDVSRYLGGIRAPEATKAYLATSIARLDQHGFGLWALRIDSGGEFAGRAGIRHTLVEDVPEFEILYALKRDFWGRGLASEIASALTGMARSQLQLPSLVGFVVAGNEASCRVFEKCGFTRERTTLSRGEEVLLYRSAAGP